MVYTVASFSGGKDSTAMVLRMIETGEALDEVVYCDTGMEFPAMYSHIEKVKQYVEKHGITFTVLKSEKSFEYYFAEKPVIRKRYGEYRGYSWPNIHMRWCTKHLKTDVTDKYIRTLRDRYGSIIFCTGLAADETKRLNRPGNKKNRNPLAEWGWTEENCLRYCYQQGYDWYDSSVGKGLYEIFNRTSCWICPLSTIDHYRQLRRYYPELWAKIGDMEIRMRNRSPEESPDNLLNAWKYTQNNSWRQLELRFRREDGEHD